jgi:hypothetical protein
LGKRRARRAAAARSRFLPLSPHRFAMSGKKEEKPREERKEKERKKVPKCR